MMIIYRLLSESFIVYGWYIRCYEELEGYVTSRLTVNNRIYILQVFNGNDLRLSQYACHNTEVYIESANT